MMLFAFYETIPRGDPVADINRDWYRAYVAEQCCPKCRQRRSDYAGKPLDINIDAMDLAPLVCTAPLPAEIGQREFLRVFEDQVADYLRFGKVNSTEGEDFGEYVTYTARDQVAIRGGPGSVLGSCEECKRVRYFPSGDSYIVVSSLMPGRLLYVSELSALILAEPLIDRIPPKLRKRFRFKRIAFRDEPCDGLEEFCTLMV